MATYAIGDIQGCHDELLALLELIEFDRYRDQVWFVGDLVNRGPKSLETLRLVRDLGDSAITVLGNHDLHLLAMTHGNTRDKQPGSLQAILDAPDRDDLLFWLRHRPLIHHDEALGYTMLHAGLPPQWDLDTARQCATEVESVIQGKKHRKYFAEMYGDQPNCWDDTLEGIDRWRFITNCFTRLRYCTTYGELGLKQKGPPGTQKPRYTPWFMHPSRKTAEHRIVFGHWSTLGYHQANNTWAIDSGCLWGGEMTALRLDEDSPTAIQLPCRGQQDPARFK
ncbi:MAG: symmetrical bis(5'-nucleosyl)-tetraphosphatase [bacterium]